jgi:hypothetical protein
VDTTLSRFAPFSVSVQLATHNISINTPSADRTSVPGEPVYCGVLSFFRISVSPGLKFVLVNKEMYPYVWSPSPEAETFIYFNKD